MSNPPNDGTGERSAAGRPSHQDATWAAPEPTPPAPPAGVPASGPPGTASSPYAATPPGQPPHAATPPGEPPHAATPPGPPGYGQPVPTPAAPKRPGALVAAASLAIVLLLCGGGGTAAFLLLRDAESGEGAPEPVVAVESFLQAVYTEKDAARATAMVCVEARDEAAIARKVQEVEGYGSTYVNPQFRWDPPTVATQDAERAIVSVKLTMTTGDEKLSDQRLRFTVVQKTGWWVCDVG